MSFRLGQAARSYFRKLEDNSRTGKFETMMDQYYLCLMAGLREPRLGKEPAADQEFIGEFPQDYNPHRFQILAALVSAEIRRAAIDPTDEKAVRKLMLDLLNPTASTSLSPLGSQLLNRYAEGGFEILQEAIPDPRELDQFLIKYVSRFCIDTKPPAEA